MSDYEIEVLESLGCEFDYSPEFLHDEDYDNQYVISYHNIIVGSELCSYEFVRSQMDLIDKKENKYA